MTVVAGKAAGMVSDMQFRVPGDPNAVRKALGGIIAALERMAINNQALHALELVLAEVLNNVVRHAYRTIQGGVIEVAVEVTEETIRCHVTDDGAPMPGGILPAGCCPAIDRTSIRDLPEGAFGWFLIRSLTSELRYRRADHRNCLSFAVALDHPGAKD